MTFFRKFWPVLCRERRIVCTASTDTCHFFLRVILSHFKHITLLFISKKKLICFYQCYFGHMSRRDMRSCSVKVPNCFELNVHIFNCKEIKKKLQNICISVSRCFKNSRYRKTKVTYLCICFKKNMQTLHAKSRLRPDV